MFACLLVLATDVTGRGTRGSTSPSSRSSSPEILELRDSRVYSRDAVEFSSDSETGDNIVQSGYNSGPKGAVEKQESIKFTLPHDHDFELIYFVHAEGGYQPQTSSLPEARAFPHPIPQFVLDQIA